LPICWRNFPAEKISDLIVRLVVAGDPDVAILVDKNSVFALGPIVALAWATPRSEQVAGAVELKHRRSCGAAFGGRRIFLRAFFVVKQCAGPVNDPDMVVAVDCNAGNLPKNPIAW
jgi:hypothetical protein